MTAPIQAPPFESAFAHALSLHQSGAIHEALHIYTQLLPTQPRHAQLLYLMGTAQLQLDQLDVGIQSIQAALAITPQYLAAWQNLAIALNRLQRFDQALESFDQVIALDPDNAQAHVQRGDLLSRFKRLEEAVASYTQALKLAPRHADAWNNCGLVLMDLGRCDEALTHYDAAIALRSDLAQAHYNKGLVLKRLKRFDQALVSYDAAIATQPDYANAHHNRGNLLHELGRTNDALADLDRAIALDPQDANAYNSRGVVLQACGRLKEAMHNFDHILAQDPTDATANWNKSNLLLLTGDFDNGWQLYEWRRYRQDFAPNTRHYRQPLWLGGESIRGKTVLLYAEQGLGDSIQFCRYAKLVSDLGAKVLLEVPRSLIGLFNHLGGVSVLIGQGASLPDFDYHCPLLSLPLAFKTNLSCIPSPTPYLSSQPDKVAAWQQRLGPQSKPRVGLVWSGNPEHKNDHNRSIALAEVWRCLPHEFDYVCLQKVVRDVDQNVLQSGGIRHFGDALHDFTDTAALCELMDVVISVDTSVAHLAAAIGRPTWLMLPYIPDWRWLLGRDDSPWYASAKLYRQAEDQRWAPVLASIGTDLHAQLASPLPTP